MCGQISALIRLLIIAGDTCDGIPFRHRSVGGDAVIAASLVAGIAGRHSEWEQDAQKHNRVVSTILEWLVQQVVSILEVDSIRMQILCANEMKHGLRNTKTTSTKSPTWKSPCSVDTLH